jgi:putative glycosyltransferase (TIGR04372 family)
MKSDRLDIILCAKAQFILGNTSGIALVGSVFGVPCALANMIPLSAMGLGPKDITIPKLFWSEKYSRYLTFHEILDSPISSFMYASLYRESGIRVEENSAEDIRWLAVEMIENLEKIDQNSFHSEEQRLEVAKSLSIHHYGYGSIANISSYFLHHHKELFKDIPRHKY